MSVGILKNLRNYGKVAEERKLRHLRRLLHEERPQFKLKRFTTTYGKIFRLFQARNIHYRLFRSMRLLRFFT